MNAELVCFVFDGRDVRTVSINGEPWIVVADNCAVLELGNITMAVQGLRKVDLAKVDVIDSIGRARRTLVVNEPGFYRLVLRSNKANTERFQDWICREVLPSIRKTGQFSFGTPMLCLKPTKWSRMFPREFYVQIFRLKGKVMPEDLSTEPWLGPLTIDLIYERLEEYLWEALQKMDPFIGRWRKRKLHQHFADGEPKAKLQAFVWECVGAMSSFQDNSWSLFVSHWNYRHPSRRILVNKLTFNCADGQLSLPFELL